MGLQFSGRELPGGTGRIEIAVGEAGAFEREIQAGITAEGAHADEAERFFPGLAEERAQEFQVLRGIDHGGDFHHGSDFLSATNDFLEFGLGRGTMEIVVGNDAELAPLTSEGGDRLQNVALQLKIDPRETFEGLAKHG